MQNIEPNNRLEPLWKIGDRIRFQHSTSDGGHVSFTLPLCRVDGSRGFFRIPDKARNMPFPPGGPGAKTLIFDLSNPRIVAARVRPQRGAA